MKKLLLIVSLVSAALATAPTSAAGGPSMLIGATEDAVRQPTLVGAKAQMDLLVLAGFNAVRVTQIWAPGETRPAVADVRVLRNVEQAARLDAVTVVLSVMNFGSRTTPLTEVERTEFASYAAALAHALPQIRTFVIGNEPNINRYWLPQFNPDGTDAAAPAYELLLGKTYDALKAVSRKITVLGGALSPHGSDDPSNSRQTHSPTQFLLDLGSTYRTSGRTKPIMDGLAFHPYEANSSIPPKAGVHPNSTTIALADYGKLVATLGKAFEGTHQRSTSLPIYDDEFGVESQIPAAKAKVYTGTEPATVKPVPESVQGAYYRQAIELAFCQPTLRGLFLFHVVDERDLGRWQSGLFYADGKPKSDLPAVRRAMRLAHRGILIRCPNLALRPRATLTVTASHARLRCDIDCTYAAELRRDRRVVRRLRGRATGEVTRTLVLRSVPPGSYTLAATLVAPVNPGPARRLTVRLTVP